MYVGGNSTQQVGVVVKSLTGTHPNPTTVSRVYHTLEAEYTVWKQRPLAAHYPYAFADSTYFSVIYEQEGVKMPVLAVMGISPTGEREMLALPRATTKTRWPGKTYSKTSSKWAGAGGSLDYGWQSSHAQCHCLQVPDRAAPTLWYP